MKRYIKIQGIGVYIPKRKVDSFEIDRIIGAPEGWTLKKAGVKTRYFVDDETTSYMGAQAAKKAVANAKLTWKDIDCIICGSGAIQQLIPSTASLIQEQLGLQHSGIPCFDINSTCLSFVTALDTISYAIECGKYKNVVIISSEISSVGLNWEQNESSILFGDGAAAAVVTKSDHTSSIIASHMETYSSGAHLSEIRGGGTMIHSTEYSAERKEDFLFDMDGRAIFKLSSKYMLGFIEKLLIPIAYSLDDIDLIVPHQASGPAMKLIRKKLGVDDERFMTIFEDYGNMISASIPFALFEAIKQKKVQRGDKILLLGTSAGLSIGGIVLEY
ncbi:beta-ketoacyl-ACP synthase III [Bacillus thuringiensis]|uniref:beta-ketoacyl-ACP synthase III n=1 Tax=Bacillus cereus group TaxID=86661 RepID=UPI00345744BC